jgi:hypothetical protein
VLRRLITVEVTQRMKGDILVPCWIAGFGLSVLITPPLGAAASLGLFVVGVCVLPAAVLIEGGFRESR